MRSPSTTGSRWSRSGLLALLACLALVVAITAQTPDPSTDYRRRWADVGIGSWGEVENASVRVTSVRLTRSAVQSTYSDPLRTEVTFVVVTVEARVRQHQVYFDNLTLHTADDRDYEPRPDFIAAELAATPPGFTRAGTEVFEVPTARVPSAQLWFDADGAAFDVYALAVRVDLALDATTPVEPGPLQIEETTVRATP